MVICHRIGWFAEALLAFCLTVLRVELDLDEVDPKQADLFGNLDHAALRDRVYAP